MEISGIHVLFYTHKNGHDITLYPTKRVAVQAAKEIMQEFHPEENPDDWRKIHEFDDRESIEIFTRDVWY